MPPEDPSTSDDAQQLRNALDPSIREAPSNVTPGAPSDQDAITPGERAQVRLIGDARAGLRVNGETVVSPDSDIAFGPEKNTLFIPERFTSDPGTLDVDVFTADGRTGERKVDVTPRDQLDEREQAANDPGQQNISTGGQSAAETDEGIVQATDDQVRRALEARESEQDTRARGGVSPEELAPGGEPSTVVGEGFRANDTGSAAFFERRRRTDTDTRPGSAGGVGLEQTPSFADGPAGGNDPTEGFSRGEARASVNRFGQSQLRSGVSRGEVRASVNRFGQQQLDRGSSELIGGSVPRERWRL